MSEPGHLALVTASPRVAPGLLSRAAWRAVEDATVVLAADVDEPLAFAVADAGLAVSALAPPEPAESQPSAPTPTASPHPTSAYAAWLARELVSRAAGEAGQGARVVWLGSADGDPGLTDALAAELSRLEQPPQLELVVGSWDVPGARLLDVVAVMDRLRSPGGCPWDAEQTHESLAPYLREETDEALEAIASGDRAHLAEELGDVLLQVAFHARVAEDAADPADVFDIDTVAGVLVDKLVRRHPHVFADGEASTPEEVAAAWERIKAEERAQR